MPTADDGVALIEHGFAVFPLPPKSKRPYKGLHGYKDATRSEAVLRSKWRDGSNLGIACGASGIVVVDIDPRNGGDTSFERLVSEVGKDAFDGTTVVNTPGGRHYLFTAPAGIELRPQRNAAGKVDGVAGIDILANGSYAVAAPSITRSGIYSWANGIGKGPELPKVLIEYLGLTENNGRTPGVVLPGDPSPTIVWNEGQRNSALTREAGRLHRTGLLSSGEIETQLRIKNAQNCNPPLPDAEVGRILESVLRYPNGIGDQWEFLCGWEDRGISGNEYLLLKVLVRGADWDGQWAPNRQQLLKKTGWSKKTFDDARKALIEAGAIDVEVRGSNLSSVYTLHRPGSVSTS